MRSSNGIQCAVWFAVGTFVLGAPVIGRTQQVRVVNLVPYALSSEAYNNSEAHIAVNRLDPRQIAVSVHWTHDTYCSAATVSAIFVTNDEGATWYANCKVTHTAASWPRDVTLAFTGDGTRLIAGYLVQLSGVWTGHISETPDYFGTPLMSVLHTLPNVDQPYLHAPPSAGRALGFGVRDSNLMTSTCNSGAVYTTTDVLVPGGLTPVCVSMRSSAGPTPAVRMVTHQDGTAYAVLYRPLLPDGRRADVIVMRHDVSSSTPFGALADLPTTGSTCTTRDGQPGYRVARCRHLPIGLDGDLAFGQQRRVGSNLSIAVSPLSSDVVYVAWADSIDDNHLTLHVRRSIDRGVTWSGDLFTVPNGTNPALAIDQDGSVGFLYQQVSGSMWWSRWETRFVLTDTDFKTRKSFVLANAPAMSPHWAFPSTGYTPYIGDYLHLAAVGRTFYGAFTASNDSTRVVFPYGAIYQRKIVAGVLQSTSGTPVMPSIDPYFFYVKKPPPTPYPDPPE